MFPLALLGCQASYSPPLKGGVPAGRGGLIATCPIKPQKPQTKQPFSLLAAVLSEPPILLLLAGYKQIHTLKSPYGMFLIIKTMFDQ